MIDIQVSGSEQIPEIDKTYKVNCFFGKDTKVYHELVEKTQHMMPEQLGIYVQTNKL